MNLIKLLVLSTVFVSFHSLAQMHFAFEVHMGTLTGPQPGPWTKFENPTVQNFWINGQRGYVLNQQEAESVKQFLNESANYGSLNKEAKLEIEKMIQYFSADNNQREQIKNLLPVELRPLPLPKNVNADNVQNALDPLWKSVTDENIKGASSALEKVQERLKKLTASERSYAHSELNRLFTYPTGQLKNLPYLPTTPVNFNSPISSEKIKPFIRAVNDLQVHEASQRKNLVGKKGIGANVQRERLKQENELIKRALKIEEFKSHYFNEKSDFPSEVSSSLQNDELAAGVISQAEDIIRNNARIGNYKAEENLSPDDKLMQHTARISSCLERGVKCDKTTEFPEPNKDVQEIYQKVSKLYDAKINSENIRNPEIKNLSQGLVSYGHKKVLEDSDDSQFYVDLATSVTDIGLGFVPVVGTAKDFVEFATGKSLLTGESLDMTTRSIMATAVVIDLASFGTGGRLTKVALEAGVNSFRTFAHGKVPAQVGKHWDDVEGFTREVLERVEFYKFDNSTVAKGYSQLHEGLKTLPSKFKILDVKEGMPGQKIAVIGRKMPGAVYEVADHLKRNVGDGMVETFSWSKKAEVEWDKMRNQFAPERIPYDKVLETIAFKENKEWAEKIAKEGYTIFDIGDPLRANITEGYSAFYDIENLVIWGKLK